MKIIVLKFAAEPSRTSGSGETGAKPFPSKLNVMVTVVLLVFSPIDSSRRNMVFIYDKYILVNFCCLCIYTVYIL